MRFANREEAGRALARELHGRVGTDAIVLGLPRGGVVTAAAVAESLQLPLDVVVSRKLRAPHQPELAVGAVAEGGARWVDRALAREVGMDADDIEAAAQAEQAEVQARVALFRGGPLTGLTGRTVVLVDDGIATGATVEAALRALRPLHPARVVVATPVAARESLLRLQEEADEVIAVLLPELFLAVGAFYDDFRQVTDAQVQALLAGRHVPRHDHGPHHPVQLEVAGALLAGELELPTTCHGVVLFAHGSGSSRHSPRNREVAAALRMLGLGTLLFDLLSEEEGAWDARTSALRFDIPLLTRRLVGAIDWAGARSDVGELPLGLFGASTGAAAALGAAVLRPDRVQAVVSRGGRPDLCTEPLSRVQAATLLIVGEADAGVLALNEEAFEQLTCPRKLAVVPGATHLFEEPGAMDDVVRLAGRWFVERLSALRRALYSRPTPPSMQTPSGQTRESETPPPR